MTYTSCISPPHKNPYIQIHEWQVRFCEENHCAAMLLAFFTSWHDWKSMNDQYYRRANDIAEMHGDGRPNNQDAYLFFTNEELQEGCLGFYGKKSINSALELLISLNVISVHRNPNPRYHFDKTKYFKFYPIICNRWITKTYVINKNTINDAQSIHFSDCEKMPDVLDKNDRTSCKNEQPPAENNRAITNTTINTTNINNTTNVQAREGEGLPNHTRRVDVNRDTQHIVDVLMAKGMSAKQFYPDKFEMIANLLEKGATMELFCEAYNKACQYTHVNGFGISYIAKIITEKLNVKKYKPNHRICQNKSLPTNYKPVYEHDFKNGLDWMGDLVRG